MMWLFVILLVLYGGFISFALFQALKRINQFEGIILHIDDIVNAASEKLKIVDNTGHFESDDEVGFIFKEIKNIQSVLNSIFEQEEGEYIEREGSSEKRKQTKEKTRKKKKK
tara:strand:+ start:626 stop:961 length:336 start_codon:yes stop_codon:yes gene_type:complete